MCKSKPSLNVHEIVSKYLVDNGFDGLCNFDGECGCDLTELGVCETVTSDCVPGYKNKCGCSGEDYNIEKVRRVQCVDCGEWVVIDHNSFIVGNSGGSKFLCQYCFDFMKYELGSVEGPL